MDTRKHLPVVGVALAAALVCICKPSPMASLAIGYMGGWTLWEWHRRSAGK